MAKKTPAIPNDTQQSLSGEAYSRQLYAIADYLAKVKFAPRFSGVDEADVWRKLEKLCELYEDALTAERMKSAQLEQDHQALQQKFDALSARSAQLLAAYRKLSGEGKPNGE